MFRAYETFRCSFITIQSFNRQLRHEAVELFLNGKNPTDISKHLGVSRQSVYNWIKRHSESGKQGLKIQ